MTKKILRKIVQILININPWHLLWSSVLFSVLFTTIIVGAMSIILRGRITQDYLITGVVTAFLVSILVVFVLVQFIDYLRKVDESLQNNINFLDTLLDAIPNPIFYKDLKGIYQGCNKVFSNQIVGLSKDRIIGSSLYDLPELIPRDLPDIFRRTDMGLIQNPETQIYEASVQCADGVKRDFILDTATYADVGGNTQGMVGVMVDITERKKSLEAVQEERDKVQKYLDIAGVILVVVNENQTVALINRKGCEILGHTEDEVIGKNWFDNFIPENDREKIRTGFLDMIAGNTVQMENFENPVLNKNGEQKIVAWHNAVLRDEEENIVATLSSGEDITERKLADEVLREERDKLKEALAKVKTLSGLLPICANCKKIRDDKGYWNQIESYVSKHSDADFSHSICPDCERKLYPDYFEEDESLKGSSINEKYGN